jgi:hypothetical protein
MAALPMMPGQPPQGPAAVSAILAGAPAPQPAAVASQDEISRAVMTQIRDLQAGVEALARQYPAIADVASQVKQLLVQAMVKIVGGVGSQAGSEAPAPRVIG